MAQLQVRKDGVYIDGNLVTTKTDLEELRTELEVRMDARFNQMDLRFDMNLEILEGQNKMLREHGRKLDKILSQQ